MYSERAADVLLFQSTPTGMQLLESDFARQWRSEIERKAMSYAVLADVEFRLINDCRLPWQAQLYPWLLERCDPRAVVTQHGGHVAEPVWGVAARLGV